MKIYLAPNLEKKNALPYSASIAEELLRLGCTVLADRDKVPLLGELPVCAGEPKENLLACDMVFSLGGDGTILHDALRATPANKPVFGINTGRLGYLAQIEGSEIGRLADLVHGRYTIEERMLLHGELWSGEECRKHWYALNDIVVTRATMGKMIDLSVECSGRHFTDYRADGVIFSTPTGSTAYSLSAGGSIVDPSIESILMTPICPHSLFDRSIVFAPTKELTVRTREINSPAEAAISIDGTALGTLRRGDCLKIKKARAAAKLVRLPDTDFYQILTQKMMQRGN